MTSANGAFLEAKDEDERARKAFVAARSCRKDLENWKTTRQTLAAERKAKADSLSARGEAITAAKLRTRLAALRKQQAEAEGRTYVQEVHESVAAEAKHFEIAQKKLEAEVTGAQRAADQLKSNLDTARGEETTTLDRLCEPWKERLTTLDARQVEQFAAERDQLIANGVAETFKALEQDVERQAEWAKQLEDVITEIGKLPADACICVAEAERLQCDAKQAAEVSDDARDGALRTRDQFQSLAAQYADITAKLRDAERDCDLHKKLDALLGQNGLQRELVRDAEQQIVELANDTLQNLSDGDLSLEQDDNAAGRDDKAFALRVRKPSDPIPTGVLFLSGSEKFRVAVSVALAVGRFASGRARPLEAVIIDEGFGSLDKDGLRAMADELKRLQRSESLKRVILVSHQEEFTDQFPVGYQLTPTETGAVATPFRR